MKSIPRVIDAAGNWMRAHRRTVACAALSWTFLLTMLAGRQVGDWTRTAGADAWLVWFAWFAAVFVFSGALGHALMSGASPPLLHLDPRYWKLLGRR